jgi:hypothetical protein
MQVDKNTLCSYFSQHAFPSCPTIAPGWPDSNYFRLLGGCFLWDVFLNYRSGPILGEFKLKIMYKFWYKIVWAAFWAIFFTNSYVWSHCIARTYVCMHADSGHSRQGIDYRNFGFSEANRIQSRKDLRTFRKMFRRQNGKKYLHYYYLHTISIVTWTFNFNRFLFENTNLNL